MSRYDVIGRMNACFVELEQALGALQQQITPLRLLAARVFSLPEVEKGQEHQAISHIAVEQHVGQAARDLALEHPEYLTLQAQLALINRLKGELEQIITVDSGLAPEQRFEFVHTHLHGLITLSAYRTLTALTNPDSVRFGWANKHIIKNIKRDDILAQLEKSLKAGRAVPPHSREQWAALVSREIDDVSRLPQYATLKIKRPVKVQPIARVWYQQQQKQVQHPCPLPLIALCQVESGAAVPKIGELLNYDVDAVKHRYKPDARPLRLLVPRLHLYADDATR